MNLIEPLNFSVLEKKPICICLGMQLMAKKKKKGIPILGVD